MVSTTNIAITTPATPPADNEAVCVDPDTLPVVEVVTPVTGVVTRIVTPGVGARVVTRIVTPGVGARVVTRIVIPGVGAGAIVKQGSVQGAQLPDEEHSPASNVYVNKNRTCILRYT